MFLLDLLEVPLRKIGEKRKKGRKKREKGEGKRGGEGDLFPLHGH